jgi:fucose 4-O-acetylase-like acetyltransferase
LKSKRIEWIDFGKGITILFVMLVHVIEGVYKTSGYENYDSISKILMAIIFTFIMPVFFALSGYLYHGSNNVRTYLTGLGKKAVNLFIPYIIFSVVYVVLQHFGGNVNNLYSWNSLIYIFEKPIGYLWFLYVLFFIFVFVGFLDLLNMGVYAQLIIYLLSFIASQVINMPYIFRSTLTWVICFYVGYLLKNITINWENKKILIILVVLLCIGCIYQYNGNTDWFHTNVLSLNNFITKIISIPIAFYYFNHKKNTTFFRYFKGLGKYSLIIYLVHAPVTSIIRVLLLRIGFTNYFVLILGISVITWFISLFVCWLSNRYTLIDAVFSPYKYIRSVKK